MAGLQTNDIQRGQHAIEQALKAVKGEITPAVSGPAEHLRRVPRLHEALLDSVSRSSSRSL
jgi:hypothetical protein